MKKALKIFWTILVVLATLLLAAWLLVQTPGVQTWLVRKALASLEDSINGRIEFSKIHLKPFNAVVLKDAVMLDNDPGQTAKGERLDTIASAKSVVATFSLKGLLKNEGVHVSRISLSDGSLTLAIEEDGVNLGRLIKNKDQSRKAEGEPGNLFDIRKVRVDHFRFRMVDTTTEEGQSQPYGINWNDMDVTVDHLYAHDIAFSHGYVTATVDELQAEEKSGYSIRSLSGKTRIGHGKTVVEDLELHDRWSDIRVPVYTMSYAGTGSFSNFIEQVRMTGSLGKGRISSKSLSYFVPYLKDMDFISLDVEKGSFDGYVDDLEISEFKFKESVSGITSSLRGRLTGLPDAGNMILDAELKDLSFTTRGLQTLAGSFSPASKINLEQFARGERLAFSGSARGPVNSLKVKGELIAGSGTANADLDIRNLADQDRPTEIGGNFRTRDLDLGNLAGVDLLGECTARGAMSASVGKGLNGVKIDTLFIDKLSALGYDYSNIVATGTYSENAFDGRVICNDPNLNFLFQGIFTLSDKTRNGLYKFYANVGYADLNALGIDKRGPSKVSAQVTANYMTVENHDVIGDLDINGLTLENAKGRYDIGDVCIQSHSNKDLHRILVTSSFLKGTYVGSKPFASMIADVQELTTRRELPALYKDEASNWNGAEYDLRLNVQDARDLLSFAMPGMYIADSTSLKIRVMKDGGVDARLKSPRIAMGRNYLKDLNLTLDNKEGSLNGVVSSSEIAVSSVGFLEDNIMLYAKDDHIGIGMTYDNGTEIADRGEIYLTGEFERAWDGKLLIHGKTLPSNIYYNGDAWSIAPSSIELMEKDLSIRNLIVSSADQSIRVDGGFSQTVPDTLSVTMDKFDLGLLNKFMPQELSISGLATGHAMLTSPWKNNAGLAMNLTCDSTTVAGEKAGTLHIASTLDEGGRMHITASNDLDGKNTIDIIGDYFGKDGRIDLVTSLDRMNVGYAAPLLSSVFSEVEGALSGRIRVSGKTGDPSFSSEGTRLDDAMLKVAFTQVPYRVSGPFHLSDEGLFFDGISMTDRYDGKGTVTGGIRFNHLKDIRMDTRIKVSRMEAVDLGADDNPIFYGNLFATGDVSIKGPFNSLLLDVDVRTDKSGRIHIPIDNAANDKDSHLLTFKEAFKEVYIDPYDVMMNRLVTQAQEGNDFGIKIRVDANQGTEAFIEIDRSAGNVLNGRGQGILDIVARPGRDLFTINGDYTIHSGNFHFNAMDIAQRDFTISEGSSIRFGGDVMDSDLNISGMYSTKASIATLISDTSSVSTRRTVNCGIGVSGKMKEPRLSFSIDVPDLDPTTKSKVESALNTEDKIQRQFLSLLISGSFIPDEQSGIVNNSNMLYSNVAELMAGQLNNILEKLDIPLDFGLNYQSSESGTNIFDVAVSTQLFNNRVLVNGNVGNREYSNSDGEVVGDVDIEIKLDKPGQVRLNLFSHSADDYTSYLDNTQRSGIGIAYQKEFNTFREFFRNLFTGRKKREQRMQEQQPVENEVNTIIITSDKDE